MIRLMLDPCTQRITAAVTNTMSSGPTIAGHCRISKAAVPSSLHEHVESENTMADNGW
jgi:hypothetical protein